MTKSITPVDETYKFTLSEETRKIAEHELRETDEVRKNALQAIREWAIRNPRIVAMRLDSGFLLRFLRARKFSLPMTQEILERYLVLRSYKHEGIEICRNLDVKLPVMQELLDLGYMFALPQRDSLGRRIILYRPRAFNPSKHWNHEMVKFHGIVYESLMEEEETQINGVVHIIDGSHVGFNYLTIFTPQDAYRIGKNLEKVLPMRHKEIYGTNVHSSVKFAIEFALSHMSEKMRNRVYIHRNMKVMTTIDKSLLPAEYGGTVPMKEMIEAFKKELEEKRDIILSHDTMSVKLEMYPKNIREGSVRSLKTAIVAQDACESKIDIYGMPGSFRKLNID